MVIGVNLFTALILEVGQSLGNVDNIVLLYHVYELIITESITLNIMSLPQNNNNNVFLYTVRMKYLDQHYTSV